MNHKSSLQKLVKAAELTHYSETEYNKAVERILSHGQSSLKFQSILSSASGAILTGNYRSGRISHNYFNDCTFENASLERATGAGSIFTQVIFSNTTLARSNFQNSTFEQCTFDACELDGVNLSGSYFIDTEWKKCDSKAFNMSDSYFKNCRFIQTKPGNLAEACLDNVHFEDLRLVNLNIEFADFKKINSKHTVFPFSQMPYVFNGLRYLTTTSDDVRISSHINESGSIMVGEYLDTLKDMEIFYSYKEEYFPLANILLASQRYDEALSAVLQGIVFAALQSDFRMCKYYCKLLTDNGHFEAEDLIDLYRRLSESVELRSLTEAQYYQYSKYMLEIRSLLVDNPNSFPRAMLVLKSTICKRESEKVMLMLSTIDDLLHLNGLNLNRPSISFSHNSPVTFIAELCGMPWAILAAASLLLTTVVWVCKGYNEIAKAIISTQEIAENHRKAEMDKLTEKKLTYELEKLKLENSELQERLDNRKKQITESGIIISHAELHSQDFDLSNYLWRR